MSKKLYLLGLIYDFNLGEQNLPPLPPAFTFLFCRTWPTIFSGGCVGIPTYATTTVTNSEYQLAAVARPPISAASQRRRWVWILERGRGLGPGFEAQRKHARAHSPFHFERRYWKKVVRGQIVHGWQMGWWCLVVVGGRWKAEGLTIEAQVPRSLASRGQMDLNAERRYWALGRGSSSLTESAGAWPRGGRWLLKARVSLSSLERLVSAFPMY